MKLLYLVRHAKSSWADHAMKDFDRPLNDRGLRDAPAMGRVIGRSGRAPDVIVTSPAVRAVATARLLAESMGLDAAAVVEAGSLYSAPAEAILEVVNGLDDGVSAAMIVGHNPGMAMLAGDLSRGGVDHMPTCAVASFELPVGSWAEVRPGRGRLMFFETPKKHRS